MDERDEAIRRENERLVARLAELEAARDNDTEDLARRLTLFEAMMETVPVGMIVADEKGRIVHGNRQVERMVRHPVIHSEDASDYGEWVSFHEDGRQVESHEYPLSQVVSRETDHAELEVCYQRGDETTFWMRIIGEPVFDAEGNRIGAAVALIDIDQQRRLAETQQILIAELNHRVKNAFSVTQSIVNRTLRKANVSAELRGELDQRLHAYALAHARLVGRKWGFAPLEGVAREVLDPIAGDRVSIGGPPIDLTSRLGIALSMAFYELATNAVKYGALSVDEGHVSLKWSVEDEGGDDECLRLSWRETGGPPALKPETEGFGSFVIGRGLQAETGGKSQIDFTDEGLRWTLEMPVPAQDKEIGFDG